MGTVSVKQYKGETQVHIQLARTNRNGFKTLMVRGINPDDADAFKAFAERQVDTNSALFRSSLRWNDIPDGDAKRSAWSKLNSDWLNAFDHAIAQADRKSTSKPVRGLLDMPARKDPAPVNRTAQSIVKEFFK
jgi:hypothetical protein